MGPKKKKTKLAANPARGFATTSIASKPRPEKKSDSAEQDEVTSHKDSTPTAVRSEASNDVQVNGQEGPKEIHQLSPEELERQLEESELQSLVEKHAQRSKRDAARQTSRLKTDKRILRGQAWSLPTRKWLPTEIMEQIIDLVQWELRDRSFYPEVEANFQRDLPEEDMTVRLWTLQQTLISLGYPEDRVLEALKHILEFFPVANASITGNKDSIWGLDETLEWLGLQCEKGEVPDFEISTPRPKFDVSASVSQTDTPSSTPQLSGTVTPTTEDDEKLGTRSITSSRLSVNGSTTTPPGSQIDESVSDVDSDAEPEELLATYLRTKLRLYELDPVTASRSSSRSKQQRSAKPIVPTNCAVASPLVTKLQKKIKKIESDVLFDQDRADYHWDEKRIDFERERAEKKASQTELETFNNGSDDLSASEPLASGDAVSREADEMGAALLRESAEAEEDGGLLGDIFANLPQSEVDPESGATAIVENTTDGMKVTIRDFRKWTGMNPRRVLEDACKARDSGAKFTYKSISTSGFSNRHSLTINWSKDQEILPSSSIPWVACSSSPRFVSCAMTSVSTPSSVQSEACISTCALFLIFSLSPKEEKAYLRLPPVWRDLWAEFAEIKREQVEQADRETLRGLRELVRAKRERLEEEGVILEGFKRRNIVSAMRDSNGDLQQIHEGANIVVSQEIRDVWVAKASSSAYRNMLQSRMQLPMWSFRDEVLEAIDNHQVVIICGETGCGKSTQVPSFILEHQMAQGRPCKVYCTEPRRISAISLARRVSEELGERKNDVGTSRSLIGYAIRLESNVSRETRLVYATTGIVMRMLESSNGLGEITHLVLDEVHERSIESDFLLIVLRKVMVRRPDLKVILMSATVDAQRFSTYLDGAPILTVPGRTFPVQTKYLEDAVELTGYSVDGVYNKERREVDLDDDDDELASENDTSETANDLKNYSVKTRKTLVQFDEYRINYDLLVKLIEKISKDERYIDYSKAILVFLPGMAEIRQLNDMLVGNSVLGNDWYIYPLHSTIASEEQERAFLVPPPGIRKIVLATNIAETGITIPDITCVIDTGKHKEMRFDEKKQLSKLIESFISRANAKQRRGRAGRVQEGLCFHLFTKARHDRLMADQQTPEMLRLSLQDLVLRVKICKLGSIEQTLSDALDPPLPKNIRRAIDALVDVKALTGDEELTPLGRQLAKLPLDVFLGKLIILGSIFNCLDAALTIAAILSSKSPFVASIGSRAQADLARLNFKKGDSDVLTVYNAYCAWRRVCSTPGSSEFQFCRKNFMNQQTLLNIEDLKSQLIVSIIDAGFLTLSDAEKSSLNRARYSSRQRQFFSIPKNFDLNSDNEVIADSIIATSFYPKLLVREGKGWRNVANNQNVSLHPTSVNKGSTSVKWLSFYHIMQSTNKFYNAHETSAVEDFAIALMCGEVEFRMYAGVLIVDGNRIRFAVSDWKVMVALRVLRTRIREILARSFRSPGKPLSTQHQRWMDIWQKIFSQNFDKDKH